MADPQDRVDRTANGIQPCRPARKARKRRLEDDSSISVSLARIAFADGIHDIPLQLCPPLSKHFVSEDLGQEVRLDYMRSLPSKDLLSWALNLTKANVSQFYDSCPGWSWSDRTKRAELKDAKAHFLVATVATVVPGGAQSNNGPEQKNSRHPIGFIHLRYEVERDEPVVYIYEFQIEPEYQGFGVGQFMMNWVETLAKYLKFTSIMLTVFKENIAAFKFYKKAGFNLDQDSPGSCDLDGTSAHGYEILRKGLV